MSHNGLGITETSYDIFEGLDRPSVCTYCMLPAAAAVGGSEFPLAFLGILKRERKCIWTGGALLKLGEGGAQRSPWDLGRPNWIRYGAFTQEGAKDASLFSCTELQCNHVFLCRHVIAWKYFLDLNSLFSPSACAYCRRSQVFSFIKTGVELQVQVSVLMVF